MDPETQELKEESDKERKEAKEGACKACLSAPSPHHTPLQLLEYAPSLARYLWGYSELLGSPVLSG